jgi:hypothetical protein
MSDRTGQFEVCCDAPPYGIVRACEGCGLRAPLDVRWCRLRHVLAREEQPNAPLGVQVWRWLLGRKRRKPQACTCGEPLPDLKKYGFSMRSKKVGDYLLGQCRRCGTMFWDEILPVPAWLEEAVVELTDDGGS